MTDQEMIHLQNLIDAARNLKAALAAGFVGNEEFARLHRAVDAAEGLNLLDTENRMFR